MQNAQDAALLRIFVGESDRWDGKPLYEYARAGQVVERAARDVTIHALELLSAELPDVAVRVACSKGTYVRTLAEDIGAALDRIGFTGPTSLEIISPEPDADIRKSHDMLAGWGWRPRDQH